MDLTLNDIERIESADVGQLLQCLADLIWLRYQPRHNRPELLRLLDALQNAREELT